MFGYSEEEALKMNIEAIVPEDTRSQAHAFLDAINRGEEIGSLEVKRKTKAGQVLDVWLTISKLVDDHGRTIAVAKTERDITERKRAEAEYRLLATVVKDSNDAVTVQDLDGQILAWNRGATKMYGYSEDEALQMNIEALVPEDIQSQARGFLEAIKRGEEIVSLELKRRTKDGRLLDVWLTTTKLVDDHGRPVAVATTERDITDRKRVG
jgi:PAS domain S-box-containing protein